MQLPPEEPYYGPWQVVSAKAFAETVQSRSKNRDPTIVAVDGRSAGGKTTLAALLGRSVPGAAVVHTDDLPSSGNWAGMRPIGEAKSFFDWTAELLEHVLDPARSGKAVYHRPESWEDWFRGEGAVEVPLECPLLILEGVGAARRELMHVLDAIIWVQSDVLEAKTRGIARDGGSAEAAVFWETWTAEEDPFLADQKPWERADFVVCGTPDLEHDPASEIVIADMRPGSERNG